MVDFTDDLATEGQAGKLDTSGDVPCHETVAQLRITQLDGRPIERFAHR